MLSPTSPRVDSKASGMPGTDAEETWPAVSVIIATRDRPELVRKAIDAVIGQTYAGDLECVVVFDQSTPDHSLARRSPGRQVRVVTNTRTPGLAGARNTGILSSSAGLVAFCDDDDTWLPDKLVTQVAALGDAGVSVTGIVIEYEDKETIRIPRQDEFTVENLVRKRLMAAHPSSVLVRRDALLEIGLVDEEIPGGYGEDYDWIIRAVQAVPISVIEAPLVRVLWGGSMFSQRWQMIIEANEYILKKHPMFSEDKKALARLVSRSAFSEAALGNRWAALRGAWMTLRLAPLERRAYLTVAVALGLISAEKLMRLANKRGRGI